jgi:hypothetical protein
MIVARALQTGASGRVIIAEQLAVTDVAADLVKLRWPVWFKIGRCNTPRAATEVAS